MNSYKTDIECDEWLTQATADEWNLVVQQCVDATFNAANWRTSSEVSFLFANDARVQQLNEQHRNKNEPTNVLSFPLLSFTRPAIPADAEQSILASTSEQCELCLLGDVVLSYDTVLKESKLLGRSFLGHTFHLMTHGVLHLLGYDHEKDSEAFLMESLEIMILQQFDIPSPYA
ncbi:MAG: rRNA maturation RNase YbeY [Holosporales bacterium]|jgi:probable rRNA maturation factor|nr:rRNA maturation RNase YbeY [Holosporales bacterium]